MEDAARIVFVMRSPEIVQSVFCFPLPFNASDSALGSRHHIAAFPFRTPGRYSPAWLYRNFDQVPSEG